MIGKQRVEELYDKYKNRRLDKKDIQELCTEFFLCQNIFDSEKICVQFMELLHRLGYHNIDVSCDWESHKINIEGDLYREEDNIILKMTPQEQRDYMKRQHLMSRLSSDFCEDSADNDDKTSVSIPLMELDKPNKNQRVLNEEVLKKLCDELRQIASKYTYDFEISQNPKSVIIEIKILEEE